MSDEWSQGMSDDTRTAFRAAAAEATEKWRQALAEAGKKVSQTPISTVNRA
jgi:TRAP-type C4-dicarboxylate transport system substrate-binding protein